ncbi:hypothetical protein HIM_08686 [Hirsutella minnesotensis 3608]|uniref:Tat pathway signal sequence n=1 Tax=Hirsutella minnesotensis 3608 TaxID=1043627 RepID=A0A0F7ZMC7_9HYPO|nr:hypothetical protein HIM_08686 [Hirsutella minnesotensis 3608]
MCGAAFTMVVPTAPAMEAVEYIDLDFDNSFDSHSLFRGPPTPEREELWRNVSIKVPANKLTELNRTDAADLRESANGYVAMIEVFHQLHCLNLVRQYTWFLAGKYEMPPPDLMGSPVGNRMHVDHCIETLRLALMCSSDVTPFFIRVDPNKPLGQSADFNSHHRCRNFQKINSWMDENWTIL